MKVVRSAQELRSLLRATQVTVGFVPTMGALHDGHMALVKQSKTENELTVVSIFVNPTQFGPSEDYDDYPRTWEADCARCEQAGVDIIFHPDVSDIYPPGFQTEVRVSGVSARLCGAYRRHHFNGVATVVARFFGLVRPHRAYFGKKDIQQCMVIRRMVSDLSLPVELVFCETVREGDGLAMSSRNTYLNSEERAKAPLLYRSLQAVERAFKEGERDAAALEAVGRGVLAAEPAFKVQYYSVLGYPDLDRRETLGEDAVCAVAAYLGETRLIDNILL